ncbi:Uncharacterised protein [Brevundimonas diminuta]|jgi:hypothetical protein|uniref:hypothetical protein n=1 Tax=Brevundimonas diminuta TaxID=293 RepID=UPI000207F7D8|nr:hypothetical protein [Brevundimonas diminuta]EGF94675.1 hypothetical protein BDIM_14990 [Brevundimonas diminuta ATCC 11568]OWR21772.1 hypothetical protein CD944_04950 [Brevundimonas diminuta]WQE46551.1 hypothetical protein U0020_06830 [Brevundimonas diminuta]SPU47991.1 Uncharacterised protein [Brevundimonas diminuta]SUW15805.1 Uncharacterised protein [Brevundimonas diminuta]
MSVLDHATAARLADAATLLLDTAREVVTASPNYRAGTESTKQVLALAVQAVIAGDHFPSSGPVLSDLPDGYVDRWEGAARGLGAAIGNLTNERVRTLTLLAVCDAVALGAAFSAAATKSARP